MLGNLLGSSQEDLCAKRSFWLDAGLQEETNFKAQAQNNRCSDAPERKGKIVLPQSLPGVSALPHGSLLMHVQQERALETKILPCSAVSISQDKE